VAQPEKESEDYSNIKCVNIEMGVEEEKDSREKKSGWVGSGGGGQGI